MNEWRDRFTDGWRTTDDIYLSVDDLIDGEGVASSHRISVHLSVRILLRSRSLAAVAAEGLCSLWSVACDEQSKHLHHNQHFQQQHPVLMCAL